jgi:formate dehydrogenase maturation protein FdhE
MIAELLKIINELLPMLTKDEAEKIRQRLDKLQKEREETDALLAKAIEAGDFTAINLLVSALLGRL